MVYSFTTISNLISASAFPPAMYSTTYCLPGEVILMVPRVAGAPAPAAGARAMPGVAATAGVAMAGAGAGNRTGGAAAAAAPAGVAGETVVAMRARRRPGWDGGGRSGEQDQRGCGRTSGPGSR